MAIPLLAMAAAPAAPRSRGPAAAPVPCPAQPCRSALSAAPGAAGALRGRGCGGSRPRCRRRGSPCPRLPPGSSPSTWRSGTGPSREAGAGPPSRSGRSPVRDPVRLVPRSHLSTAAVPGAEGGDAAAAARVGSRRGTGAGSILRPGRGRTGRRLSRQRPRIHPPGEGCRQRAGLHGEGWGGGGRGQREAAPGPSSLPGAAAAEAGTGAGGEGGGRRAGRRRAGRGSAAAPLPARPPAAAALRHRPGRAGRAALRAGPAPAPSAAPPLTHGRRPPGHWACAGRERERGASAEGLATPR